MSHVGSESADAWEALEMVKAALRLLKLEGILQEPPPPCLSACRGAVHSLEGIWQELEERCVLPDVPEAHRLRIPRLRRRPRQTFRDAIYALPASPMH